MSQAEAIEFGHQDAWYEHAIRERIFEREGFKRLIAWNLAHFRRAVDLTPEMRLLSIGCGMGEYELILAREVSSIVGFDLSPVAIEEATRRARESGLDNLVFQAGSLRQIELAPEQFDVVFAFGVLHHLSRDERLELLAAAAQWLTPVGRLYVRDPNADGWLRRALEPWFRGRSEAHSPNEGAIAPADLIGELTETGFSILDVVDTDVIAGPLPWLLETSSSLLWNLVFGFDRLCLATPGFRRLSSQFAVTACR